VCIDDWGKITLVDKKVHTFHGILSLTFGVVGLISYFLLGLFFGLPLGVLAVIIGLKERKVDSYANYGFLLGIITIILGIVGFIAAAMYLGLNV